MNQQTKTIYVRAATAAYLIAHRYHEAWSAAMGPYCQSTPDTHELHRRATMARRLALRLQTEAGI